MYEIGQRAVRITTITEPVVPFVDAVCLDLIRLGRSLTVLPILVETTWVYFEASQGPGNMAGTPLNPTIEVRDGSIHSATDVFSW